MIKNSTFSHNFAPKMEWKYVPVGIEKQSTTTTTNHLQLIKMLTQLGYSCITVLVWKTERNSQGNLAD